jgi:hypothetical protein
MERINQLQRAAHEGGIRCRPVLEAVSRPAKMCLLERVPLRKLSRFGFEGPEYFRGPGLIGGPPTPEYGSPENMA